MLGDGAAAGLFAGTGGQVEVDVGAAAGEGQGGGGAGGAAAEDSGPHFFPS